VLDESSATGRSPDRRGAGRGEYLILRESDVLAKVIVETKAKGKKKELAGAAA
jgi:hypothetical protein